jgi:RNA polymerase sigma-70 factor (ECF subfamily)
VLEISGSAVHSLLHRARSTLRGSYASEPTRLALTAQADRQTQKTLERYLHAWEAADIGGIVALLTENATFSMPPFPAWFQGRSAIRRFLSETILAGDARGRFRLLPVRASGQPGFGFYQLSESGAVYVPFAIQVLHFRGTSVADVTTFGYPHLFSAFDLPVQLPRK